MRDDREKLHDILEAIERINRYVVLGRERFDSDELVQVTKDDLSKNRNRVRL